MPKIFDIRPPQKSKEPLVKIKEKKIRHFNFFRNIKGFSLKNISVEGPLIQTGFFKKKILVISLLCVGGIFLLLHFSAKAQVEIWPKMRTVSLEEYIESDIELLVSDFSKNAVKGDLLSKEKGLSQNFETSGISQEQGRSSGKIRIVNDYHLSQVLVEKTRFVSADGKLFHLQDRAVVQANSSLEVEVAAAELGQDYNIEPTTFSIPGLLGSPRYTFVYAESSETMKGGFSGESSQVEADDLVRAEQTLESKISQALKQEIEEQAGSSYLFPEGAFEYEVLEKSYSVEVGDTADSFDFYFKMEGKALMVKKSELEKFAYYVISANIDENERIKDDSLILESSVDEIDFESGKLSIKLMMSAEVFKDIDTLNTRRTLTDKTIEESKSFLNSCSDIEEAKIRIFPFWRKRIPDDIEDVELLLNLNS